jgi:hypothetical protein
MENFWNLYVAFVGSLFVIVRACDIARWYSQNKKKAYPVNIKKAYSDYISNWHPPLGG